MAELFNRLNSQERTLRDIGLKKSAIIELRNFTPSEQTKLDNGYIESDIFWDRAMASLPQPLDLERYLLRLQTLRNALAVNGLPGFGSIVELVPHSDDSMEYRLPDIEEWPDLYNSIFDREQEVDPRFVKGKGAKARKGQTNHIHRGGTSFTYPHGGYEVDVFGDGNFNQFRYKLEKNLSIYDQDHEVINRFYADLHYFYTRTGSIASYGTSLSSDKMRWGYMNDDRYMAHFTFNHDSPIYDARKFNILAEVAARSVLELNPVIS